jgi:DNA-binding response OmpR family regulator
MVAGPTANLPAISPADKTVAVLAVSPCEEDHACLRDIFLHTNWKIDQSRGMREALQILRQSRPAVLICESTLPDGTWKELFEELAFVPDPPLLVVTARNADDSLWAEVLNLGAYDVLSKPFDRSEVTRIISLAWLHWKESVFKQPKSAKAAGSAPAIHTLSATA